MNKFLALIVMVLLIVFIVCYPAVIREALISKIKHTCRAVRNRI